MTRSPSRALLTEMERPASEVVFAELERVLPAGGLIKGRGELEPYGGDALTMYRQKPLCVVLPTEERQIASVLRVCSRYDVPVVTRGAGTGLSGGALPHEHGVLLVTSKLNKIVRIDPLRRQAVVQPGARNLDISTEASRYGLFYPPDPSSQVACTIGGNVAENSGGVRCLKYGLTVHNVHKLRCLNANGEEFNVGGADAVGYDLLALLHGSEGMLAVVVEVTVDLTPLPESTETMMCAFDSYGDAGDAVAAVIAAGLVPAGLEMMDGLSVELVEEFLGLGYPQNAQMVMICETDGLSEDARMQIDQVARVCRAHHARDLRFAATPEERDLMWRGRKSALPACGRRAPDYYCIDGTIPRRQLGAVLERIAQLSADFDLPCCNVFHAADGNLHPLIMFDVEDKDQARRTIEFGSQILQTCLDAGGTITGEHGVGVEKLNEMCVQFSSDELTTFAGVKKAFDPNGVLNPGKAIPTLSRCAEFGAMHVHKGQLAHPELERF